MGKGNAIPLRSGVNWNTACYAPVLRVVRQLVQAGQPAIVAIDGRCGSGKTRLADYLQQEFSCNVFHMDDFYLPFAARMPDWMEQLGGNVDFERFRKEIIEPIQAGKPVQYRAYDCRMGDFRAPVERSAGLLTVVEGSYAHHPALDGYAARKVFLTCSEAEQTRRLQAREGERFEMFRTRWIPLEERYFAACGIEAASDLVLDTSRSAQGEDRQ